MANFVDYITSRRNLLKQREHLLDLFAYVPGRAVYPEKPALEDGLVLQVAVKDPKDATYGYYEGDTFVKILKSKHAQMGAPFHIYDRIEIDRSNIANGPKTKTSTTIGRYILNEICFASITGDLIEYVNTAHRGFKKQEQELCNHILDGGMNATEYNQYVQDGMELCHFGDLFVPTMTKRGTSIDPKIIERRDELLKALTPEQLNDPKIMVGIEKELVGMYKEYLKGDPAYRFYCANPKSLDVLAKRMFIMVGGVTDFGSQNLSTITTSLSEGLTTDNFVQIFNDARKGAYARGIEPRISGTNTILLNRSFQDIRIMEDDCKTKRTVEVSLTKFMAPKLFLGRYHAVNGTLKEIKMADLKSLEGKTIHLRSPLMCESKALCYTCTGSIFKKLGITSPGILTIDISAVTMQQRMSAMHVESLVMKTIDWKTAIAV